MANRRERRKRRQRLRNLRYRKIEGAGIIDDDSAADMIITSKPDDEIGPIIMDGADFINSMPDEMLHHILSFISTEMAMRTCVLSKRWRHVWCETPYLDIDGELCRYKARKIKENLIISFTAPKITSFKLRVDIYNGAAEIDSWLELAISRNVQNLSVELLDNFSYTNVNLAFPDFFYRNSSLKQLSVLHYYDMKPRCTVSWKSLRKLSLRCCKLRDKTMANILSGCPILESLTLCGCTLLERLDLSESPSLRRLEIDRRNKHLAGPILIVAPHIHYLSLINSNRPISTLVDVSSLTEANLDICISPTEARLCQTMAIAMLAKSRNVERLTLGPTFLKILSIAVLRGAPFPTLKVQTLIIKTELVRSIIPGLARLLLHSPGLKKLAVDTMKLDLNKLDMYLEHYSDSQGLMNPHRCWRSEYDVFPTSEEMYTMLGCNDATSKLLASFMELVLRNSKTLESMVVWLGGVYFNNGAQWFQDLLQMAATFSHDNNVSIVLKPNNYFKYY